MIATVSSQTGSPTQMNRSLAGELGVIRRGTGLLGAGVITAGLIFAMTQLIDGDEVQLEPAKTFPLIKFVHVPEKEEVITVKPEPPKEIVPPKIQKKEFVAEPSGDIEGIHVPRNNPKVIIKGPVISGIPGGMPMVPIAPKYPDRAATLGLCGQVLVQFDISAAGIPTNVQILETSSRHFNKESVRAVERARYKPFTEGGVPTTVYGKQELITFKLEGGC